MPKFPEFTEADWAAAEQPFVCKWLAIQRIGNWHRLHQPATASAITIMLDSDGRVAMVRQYRNAICASTLELPRGGSNSGEDHIGCALREALEETGVAATRDDATLLGKLHPDTGIASAKVGVVLVRIPRIEASAPSEGDEEIDTVEFHHLSALDDMIRSGGIVCGMTIAALSMLKLASI